MDSTVMQQPLPTPYLDTLHPGDTITTHGMCHTITGVTDLAIRLDDGTTITRITT
jgi:preprotein translocase subunit YajC